MPGLIAVMCEPMKIVGICGSLRDGSFCWQALNYIKPKFEAVGVEVEIVDLRNLELPFCDGGTSYPGYPDVEALQQKVISAQGLILATPEYHGSMSGVMKNALDLMSKDQLGGKVVGLLSVLGGQANSNALNHLRLVMRWVYAYVIPQQLSFAKAYSLFDEQGAVTDEKLEERIDLFVEALCAETLLRESASSGG